MLTRVARTYSLIIFSAVAARAIAVDRMPVADDKNAAVANARAIEKLWADSNGPPIPPGQYFVAGPIRSPLKIGGRLAGAGGRGIYVESDWSFRGKITTFTAVNGQPILRLRGTGQIVENIELRGRPFTGIGTVGTRPPTLVEIEGRTVPPTGRHVLDKIGFMDADVGIRALGGYYDDSGTFVPLHQHVDNCLVDGAIVFACSTFFRSENQQALNWRFTNLDVNIWKGGDPVLLFDLAWGGNLTADQIAINHPFVTICRVSHFSPWTRRLRFNEIFFDRPPMEGPNPMQPKLRLFEYDPPDDKVRAWEHWDARFTGNIGCEAVRIDKKQFYKVPDWFYKTGLRYEFTMGDGK